MSNVKTIVEALLTQGNPESMPLVSKEKIKEIAAGVCKGLDSEITATMQPTVNATAEAQVAPRSPG